ncbi:MAG: NADH:flavin oxidoreductase/NADH oxidase family protein [Moorea sp. SIO4A5]|nr:NADH:flavin oxidoreductase/NADH oxidase family protein [Moorena sp. SIO4A5]
MPDLLNQPLTLPCGAVLSNRLAKAAMSEGLADSLNRPTEKHMRLYKQWSEGGCGLLITGNVQVDRKHMERVGNIAIDDQNVLEQLKALVKAGTSGGNHLWMQISHAGRQSPLEICPHPVAPSSIGLELRGGNFGKPRPLEPEEIETLIERFGRVAEIARNCGFTGVQIHAAHGYLISQFLSPLSNQRMDDWSGNLENRSRFLFEVYRSVRSKVGSDFPVAVKLNSSDFQKGGFSYSESLEVLNWLEREGVDLVEISGGNYENPVTLFGDKKPNNEIIRESTQQREAFFLTYTNDARKVSNIPLMITGGFRSRQILESVLREGALDVIGIARPLVGDPHSVKKLLDGEIDRLPDYENQLQSFDQEALGQKVDEATMRNINAISHMGWFYMQLIYLGEGKKPDLDMTTLEAFHKIQMRDKQALEAWQSPW